MKKCIKFILSFALCAGLLQPQLQATPFSEFCRKWAARGAAVGYWGILSYPMIGTAQEATMRHASERYLKMEDENNEPIFKDLKKDDPETYQAIERIYKKNGMPSLDDSTVKVAQLLDFGGLLLLLQKHPEYSLQTTLQRIPIVKNTKFASHFDAIIINEMWQEDAGFIGGNTIMLSERYMRKLKTIGGLAAVLAHEHEHGAKNHQGQIMVLECTAPFVIHGVAKKMYDTVASSQSNQALPSITRSLLRIPRAGAIIAITQLLSLKQRRDNEREADAVLQRDPILARTMAKHHGAYISHQERAVQEFKEDLTSYVGPVIADYAAEPLFALYRTHPLDTERVAYLEKWAKEAEEKKESEKH